jgi:16S rRNA (cytosine967-C5)-methyltransferase
MRPEAVIQKAGHLLTAIFTSSKSADRIIDGYFRNNRLGKKERAMVGDVVYSALRHRLHFFAMLCDISITTAPTFIQLAGAALAAKENLSPKKLAQLLGVTSSTTLPDHFTPLSQLDLAQQVSLPDWLLAEFTKQWGGEEAQKLALALNEKPQVDLRINSRVISRFQALVSLAVDGVDTEFTPYSPDGLRLQGRYALKGLESFKQGEWEIQEEGSQLISQLLKPYPGNTIIDLCAGGGGKSLHLATLMGDEGQVIATDINPKRLNRIKERQKRAKLRSITLMPIRHEGDAKLRRFTGAANGVLVDAPCSGTGTIRRNPEIKWRLTPDQLFVYQQKQGALLDAGARLVKKGGRLVYATCSLLACENQDIVKDFLKHNGGFELLDANREIEGLPHDGPFLTLLPHRTNSDGFFAAAFKRKK